MAFEFKDSGPFGIWWWRRAIERTDRNRRRPYSYVWRTRPISDRGRRNAMSTIGIGRSIRLPRAIRVVARGNRTDEPERHRLFGLRRSPRRAAFRHNLLSQVTIRRGLHYPEFFEFVILNRSSHSS